MDAQTDMINNRDHPSRTFYDSTRCAPKPNVRRQTRHAASDVDFRMDHGRISENDNLRKRRTRHSSGYGLSKSVHNNSMDSCLNDQHRCKKPEASLTQHLEHTTSKKSSSVGKNRSVHQQDIPTSPRAVSAHQRSHYHRPGTSRSRNNPGNTGAYRLVRKHGNIEPCECTRLDSPLRDVVNSDEEDADFRLPQEHHSRNICKDSELYWHSPPGEPHSEPEMDSPPVNRRRDYSESNKRLSGQGESIYDNCRELQAKVSIETGSSVDIDVRKQCERDQQELKDLYEDIGEFVKRNSAGRIGVDSNDEEYAWDNLQQQPEEKDAKGESQDLLESINQFVGKISIERKGNASRVATDASTRGSKARSKNSTEQPRARCSKLDTRKTYHSGMDGRTVAGSQQQELGRNFDEDLANIQLKSFMQVGDKENEETKGNEYLSDTSEEARELAREDTELRQIHRHLSKSWTLCKRDSAIWNPQIFDKGEEATLAKGNEEKMFDKPKCEKKRVNTEARSKGRREKEVMICEESVPLRRNHLFTNEAERKDSTRTISRERCKGKEEMDDKIHEDIKNCYGVSVSHGIGNLELETSKTKTCIDEIIDNGLNREMKRTSDEILRKTVKDLQCEANGSVEEGPLKRGTSDVTSKFIRPDSTCPVLRRPEHTRATRGVCFCKNHGEIVLADQLDTQDYVRKLKNYRWAYLNHMQNDLQTLYGLEKFLDSCSPERRPLSASITTAFSPEAKEPKNLLDKTDKARGCEMESRLQ